jgi:hypothetical protein
MLCSNSRENHNYAILVDRGAGALADFHLQVNSFLLEIAYKMPNTQ